MKKTPENIKKIFNTISFDYDNLNDIISLWQHKKIKKDILKPLKNTKFSKVLDLCTGTGDIAGLIKKSYPEARVFGIDFSSSMLEIAKSRYKDITFVEGDCEQIPFDDNFFDVCIISFGLRNVENINTVLKEIYRVLKKDGIFINLDLGKPCFLANIFLKPYMKYWVKFLGKVFHGNSFPYEYFAKSNDDFPSPIELCEKYKNIGFTNIRIKDYIFGQISAQVCIKN